METSLREGRRGVELVGGRSCRIVGDAWIEISYPLHATGTMRGVTSDDSVTWEVGADCWKVWV